MSTIQEVARIRRLAARQGTQLRKMRNGGGYELIDINTRALILGDRYGVGVGADLDAVRDWLATD
ncbi:MAG: hypothetical protein WCI74_13205 [Actinomycetes bacterium]